MTDFEKVTDFHNMYRAFRRAKSGKGFKKSSARFNVGALDGVNLLIDQLKNRTYRVSGYSEFKVYEPKERVIQTSSFKDKVVQHCLCDNVLLPRMEQIFLKENCAGQKGKGTLYGLDLLQEQMLTFYNRYGMEGYILKCDVTKFFYNIAHEPLMDIVHYHFGYDPGICWLCDQFIDSTEGKGLPLGNQINQGFALLYLDSMDKVIRCELGIEFYGRYMDDFYLIHPSEEYLQHCLKVITAYLETLELTLNRKTQIFPFRHGVSYLGFHTYITPDGTPIRKVKNQNKRNAQKKFLRMAKLVAAGKLPEEKFQASYGAYKNHISHGNCYRLGQAMDEIIRKELDNGRHTSNPNGEQPQRNPRPGVQIKSHFRPSEERRKTCTEYAKTAAQILMPAKSAIAKKKSPPVVRTLKATRKIYPLIMYQTIPKMSRRTIKGWVLRVGVRCER